MVAVYTGQKNGKTNYRDKNIHDREIVNKPQKRQNISDFHVKPNKNINKSSTDSRAITQKENRFCCYWAGRS